MRKNPLQPNEIFVLGQNHLPTFTIGSLGPSPSKISKTHEEVKFPSTIVPFQAEHEFGKDTLPETNSSHLTIGRSHLNFIFQSFILRAKPKLTLFFQASRLPACTGSTWKYRNIIQLFNPCGPLNPKGLLEVKTSGVVMEREPTQSY